MVFFSFDLEWKKRWSISDVFLLKCRNIQESFSRIMVGWWLFYGARLSLFWIEHYSTSNNILHRVKLCYQLITRHCYRQQNLWFHNQANGMRFILLIMFHTRGEMITIDNFLLKILIILQSHPYHHHSPSIATILEETQINRWLLAFVTRLDLHW